MTALDENFSRETGATVGELPAEATVSQIALSAHPFMWALDTVLFAGPDAHRATEVYAQGGRISTLDVSAYRILSTTDGIMNLLHVL